MSDQNTLSSEMQNCIDNCIECQKVCFQMAMTQDWQQAAGKPVEQDLFRLLINCAEICHVSANFMLSNSPLHAAVCAACADVCDSCAKSCDEAGGMAECAQASRRCAESCEDMARSHGAYAGFLPASDAASMAHV